MSLNATCAHPMKARNISIDQFDLQKDISKLNFSMHIGGGEESSGSTTGAKTLFYGGKQAKLESAGDDLDQEFFAMGNVEGKLNTPFHKKTISLPTKSDKKHNKKNKKQEKKHRFVAS